MVGSKVTSLALTMLSKWVLEMKFLNISVIYSISNKCCYLIFELVTHSLLLSLPLSLFPLSLFLSFPLSLVHSLSLSFFLSFYLSIFLSFYLSLCLCVSLSLCLSFSLSLFFSFSLFLFFSFSLFLFSLFLFVCLSNDLM
jgi:hypothetical protein